MFDFTPILQALIALLSVFLTVKVVPWIKAKTTEQQQAVISMVVQTLVFAAEQMYLGEGRGQEKLQYVMEQLRAKGYNIDLSVIEAEVAKMNLGW